MTKHFNKCSEISQCGWKLAGGRLLFWTLHLDPYSFLKIIFNLLVNVRLEVIHSSETIKTHQIVLKSSEVTPIGIVPMLQAVCHVHIPPCKLSSLWFIQSRVNIRKNLGVLLLRNIEQLHIFGNYTTIFCFADPSTLSPLYFKTMLWTDFLWPCM